MSDCVHVVSASVTSVSVSRMPGVVPCWARCEEVIDAEGRRSLRVCGAHAGAELCSLRIACAAAALAGAGRSSTAAFLQSAVVSLWLALRPSCITQSLRRDRTHGGGNLLLPACCWLVTSLLRKCLLSNRFRCCRHRRCALLRLLHQVLYVPTQRGVAVHVGRAVRAQEHG